MNRQLYPLFKPFIAILLMATIIFYYAGLDLGLQGIGFTILFPLLFAVTFVIDKGASIYTYQETILFLLFLVLTLASVFYTDINMDGFGFTFNKILAAFMGAYIGIAIYTHLNLEDYFHIAFIVSLLIIIYFEYSFGNFNPTTFYAPTALRSDFSYNANYYSYMSLFSNFSIFRLHLKYKNIWTLLGLILIPILGITISFTTQSRSGLIFILLINTIFWFWINKPKISNPVYSIIQKVLLLVFTIVFILQLFRVYDESKIQNRMSASISEDARGHLAEKGLEVFVNYPFTGVGAGNFVNYTRYRAFTHNTYIEALAEHGFFIGSIVILIFVLPIFKSYKLFTNNTSNPEYRLNLLFFAVFFLHNNIYVFYQASNAMMFFFFMLGIHYKMTGIKKIQ